MKYGLWVVMIWLFLGGPCADAASAKRPNVVYIMADDLGIGDVKCYGRERCRIDTPNIDRLADQGLRFTDAHTAAAHCIPTRLAVMTGRYPWRFRPPHPSGPWAFLNPRISASRLTLGKMMHAVGYRTGYVGKWHLGTLMPTRDGRNQNPKNVDYTKPLKIGPPQYGFDHSFILPGSLDMYPYVFIRNNRFVGQVTAQKGWSAFHRVGPAAENFEDYKTLDAITREAVEFINRQSETAHKGRPFFLYFALTAPRTPICPSAKFVGKSKLGLYGDFVMEMDDCVGRVLKSLRRHNLTRDTLVLATSDNGAASYAGNVRKATPGNIHRLEKLGHYSSGIYRGYKFSAYEGGTRVPLIIRWPGVVSPDSQCDRLVGLVDVMRTLADVCSGTLPDAAAPDSVSFAPLLHDPNGPSTRTSLIMQSTRNFVVRLGEWKLILCPGSGASGHWGNRPAAAVAWKQALKLFGHRPTRNDLRRAPFVQLFNLNNDVREAVNLAASHPDVVERLHVLLDERVQNGRSTPGKQLRNDVERVNYYSGIPRFVLSTR